MKMNIREIERYARKFLMEEYQMDLNIPIHVDGRMTTTMGLFRIGNKSSICMKFSKELLVYNTIEEIEDTIKHECIHYALFEKGLPWRDRDNFFKEQLKFHGCRTDGGHYIGRAHLYACTNCNHSFTRKKRFNTKKYNCGRCSNGKLVYVKQIIKNKEDSQ